MNFLNKFLLSLVLLPARFYERLGVNVFHLRSILTVKLMMDDRRPNTFQQARQKKKEKPVSSATLGTMLLTGLLGSFFLIGFFVGKNYVTHLTFYFALFIFMLASTLITDFTSVLIDVRDNYIILPKPVSDRTVVVARLLHITIHISKLVLPMSLPGIIFVWIKYNAWGSLVLLIMILLATLLTIFLINALYIFILRVTTPQKFQSVISYFQIIFAILIYGSYQVVPQMVDKVSLKGYDISASKWIWLAPPYWFAGGWQLLAGKDFQPEWLLALIISFAVPIFSVWIVVKYFAPSFNQKLSQISGSSSETTAIKKGSIARPAASPYVNGLAKIFTRNGAERMAFLFCWKMTGRSKDFKMKVYPGFGYLLVYAVVLIYNSHRFTFYSLHEQTREGKILLISILYFSSFMLIMAIAQISFSDKYKAAWIYFVTPINPPGQLLTGAFLSVLIKFYLPILVLIAIPAISIIGPSVIPNLLLGLCNQVLISSLIAYVNLKQLPFSVSQSNAKKSGAFIRGAFTLMIPATIGLVHYLLYSFTWVILLLAALSLTATWLVMGTIRKTSWQKITAGYEEL